ncbi:MAG TPA: PglZ domain-containing protein [Deltaproteobacteria bacterium]|nr:PglZ domain-containing protein [Deltaproteobacteria bacterium]
MAVLLPHEKLAYKPNGDVLADGHPMASLEQRSRILDSVEGLAVKADDLLQMKKGEGRDFIKDKRLIYIYHNAIDATGDSASTEGHTFEAVRRAINDLASVVTYVINNLNGHHVLVTSDHGFVFTESSPGEPDKSSVPDKPPGNGSLTLSGFGSVSAAKEAVKVGFDYYKANASGVSASVKAGDHNYHIHIVEPHNTGPTKAMTLTAFVALCSAVLGKSVQSQLVVLGSMSLGGSIVPVQNLAESLQVAFDAGAKRILLPMASVGDIPSIPGELFAKFQTGFYADPQDAVFKALGVE